MNILLAITIFLVAGSFLWRAACRKWVIPWPSWLAWMLENPYMLVVAHSNSITDYLNLQPGMAVADLGCGGGRISIPAAKKVGVTGHVDAYDVQEKMLQKTKTRALKNGIKNINLIQGKIESGSLKSNHYDRVILVTVLGEIPNQDEAIKEISASLKKGAILSITEVIPDPFYQSKKSVRSICSKHGLISDQFRCGLLSYTINFKKT